MLSETLRTCRASKSGPVGPQPTRSATQAAASGIPATTKRRNATAPATTNKITQGLLNGCFSGGANSAAAAIAPAVRWASALLAAPWSPVGCPGGYLHHADAGFRRRDPAGGQGSDRCRGRAHYGWQQSAGCDRRRG